MNEIVKYGYLIQKVDYDIFDQILTYLTQEGNILVLFASGVRKITSKNSYHIKFNQFTEIELFFKPFRKMQKLKKLFIKSLINANLDENKVFMNFNKIIAKLGNLIFNNKQVFEIYQQMISLFLINNNFKHIFNFSLLKIFSLLFRNINFDCCFRCMNFKRKVAFNLSLGFICEDCFIESDTMFSEVEIKLLQKYIKNDFFDINKEELFFSDLIYKKIQKMF